MEQFALQFLPERRVFTVSELNSAIRGILDREFQDVWIVGEISGTKLAASGLPVPVEDVAPTVAVPPGAAPLVMLVLPPPPAPETTPPPPSPSRPTLSMMPTHPALKSNDTLIRKGLFIFS